MRQWHDGHDLCSSPWRAAHGESSIHEPDALTHGEQTHAWPALFRTLDVLRIYDLPAILTQGGGGSGHATTSLSILVIDQIRQGFNSASALATLVFLLVAFVAFIFVRFLGADVVQRAPGKTKKRWFRRSAADATVEGE